MWLVGGVDLEVEMVSVGIPRISNCTDELSLFDYISFLDINARQVGIIGVDIGFIRKRVLDRHYISPTRHIASCDNRPFSYSDYRSSCRGRNVDSLMASVSTVPPIVIGCAPQNAVDSSIGGIRFVFGIVGIHNFWDVHLAVVREIAPCLKFAGRLCDFFERVAEI